MIPFSAPRKFSSPRRLLFFGVLSLFLSSGIAAATNEIKGTVRNQTVNQPAANDDVLLLRLDSGTPEESRAKTDAQGAFSLAIKDPTHPYLLRVLHQGVAYDQKAIPGDTLDLQVFDSSPNVPNIAGTIEILRAGTTSPKGSRLHVSDMYEIRNDSNPPVTQAAGRTFDVYLPPQAQISSVLAAGPGNMGESVSATPIPGEPGHFTINFPLRPGATKFAFNYDVPYSGHLAFATRHAYSVQQMAVMLPPSMKFASQTAAFAPLKTGNNKYQVEAAARLPAGKGPAFELSGSGELPPLGDQAKSQTPGAQPLSPYFYHPAISAPAAALQIPVPSPGPSPRTSPASQSNPQSLPSSSQSFVLGGLSGILLATCAFLVWQMRKPRKPLAAKAVVNVSAPSPANSSLSQSLREELSRLERDLQRGSISATEYLSTKQALERTSQRAGNKPN